MKKIKKTSKDIRYYRFMEIETRKSRLSESSDRIITENLLHEYLKAFDPDDVQSFDNWLAVRHEGSVYMWRPEATFHKQFPEYE